MEASLSLRLWPATDGCLDSCVFDCIPTGVVLLLGGFTGDVAVESGCVDGNSLGVEPSLKS